MRGGCKFIAGSLLIALRVGNAASGRALAIANAPNPNAVPLLCLWCGRWARLRLVLTGTGVLAIWRAPKLFPGKCRTPPYRFEIP
jgi:hypothetical protein